MLLHDDTYERKQHPNGYGVYPHHKQPTDLPNRRIFSESMLCSKSVVVSAPCIISGYRGKASVDSSYKSGIIAQSDAAQTVHFSCGLSKHPMVAYKLLAGWATIACGLNRCDCSRSFHFPSARQMLLSLQSPPAVGRSHP